MNNKEVQLKKKKRNLKTTRLAQEMKIWIYIDLQP